MRDQGTKIKYLLLLGPLLQSTTVHTRDAIMQHTYNEKKTSEKDEADNAVLPFWVVRFRAWLESGQGSGK